MTKHDSGKMGKMPKLVRGERGVSILGALVVALMLGAGAVATFELATPLSSVSPDSQVALTSAQLAAQKKAAAEKAELEKKIESQCLFLKVKLAKPGDSKGGGETPLEEYKGTIEKDKCVSAFYLGTTVNPNNRRCFGLKSTIQLNRNPGKIDQNGKKVLVGKVISVPSKDVPKGECKTEIVGEDGKKLSPEDLAAIYKANPEYRNNIIDQLGPSLDKAQRDELSNILGGEIEEKQKDLVQLRLDHNDVIGKIEALEKDGKPVSKDLRDEEQELAEKKSEAARELDKLRAQQKSLADVAAKGPPIVKKPPTDKDNNDNDNNNNRPPPSTFPPPSPGPGGGDGGPKFTPPSSAGPQSFPGRPPAAGNGVPQPPGTCSPSVICGNNTLYSRNNQCVDQVMQQCQYGCSGTQCAQAPQQGQGCQQAPSQPDPAGCQNGSWRPTYTGACVSSWQCVPTGGTGSGGQLSAAISCQPQVADVGMTIAITYSCSSGTSEGSGFQTGGALTGSTTVTIANPPAGTNVATYGLKCTDQGASASKQCSVQIAKPAIVLVANPKVVLSGKTSAIGWVTSGMQSCVVSSPDLPAFTDQHKNTTNVNGTVTTPALTSGATFVLKCVTIGGSTKEASTAVTIQ